MMGRQQGRWRHGLTWILAAGCLLVLPAGLHAKQPAGMSANLAPELVTVRVTLPSGKTFQATAWEGDALTFQSERLDVHLALVPTVQDRVTGDVTISLYPLMDDGSVMRITGGAERIDTRLGIRSIATSLLDVEVVKIRQATPQELAGYMTRKAARVDLENGFVVGEAGCCVGCGGSVYCGCEVIATCGSCCNGCCGGFAK